MGGRPIHQEREGSRYPQACGALLSSPFDNFAYTNPKVLFELPRSLAYLGSYHDGQFSEAQSLLLGKRISIPACFPPPTGSRFALGCNAKSGLPSLIVIPHWTMLGRPAMSNENTYTASVRLRWIDVWSSWHTCHGVRARGIILEPVCPFMETPCL